MNGYTYIHVLTFIYTYICNLTLIECSDTVCSAPTFSIVINYRVIKNLILLQILMEVSYDLNPVSSVLLFY